MRHGLALVGPDFAQKASAGGEVSQKLCRDASIRGQSVRAIGQGGVRLPIVDLWLQQLHLGAGDIGRVADNQLELTFDILKPVRDEDIGLLGNPDGLGIGIGNTAGFLGQVDPSAPGLSPPVGQQRQ